jgi:hypothetical protein
MHKFLKFFVPSLMASLITASCNFSGSIRINETPVYYEVGGAIPDEIVFGGKVVNSSTGEWPNNRLILLFLKSKEIHRTLSATGEFTGVLSRGEPTQVAFGVVDGLFLLRAPNIYELTPELLIQDNIPVQFRRAYFPNRENNTDTVSLYYWFDEFQEGEIKEFYIPAKNITYTVYVVNGAIDTLPSHLLVKGSTELLENGEIVVNLPGTDEALNPAQLSDVAVEEIQYLNQVEETEINRLTIPLDNCGGSVELSQKYTYTQTFIHEYTTETGFTIGGEIPVYAWAKILAEIQTKYGFKNGQIDTRAIEYNMAAAPGTSVVYYVAWKEVWETGTGNVSVSNSELNVPFRVKTNVVYEVSSEPRTCP